MIKYVSKDKEEETICYERYYEMNPGVLQLNK